MQYRQEDGKQRSVIKGMTTNMLIKRLLRQYNILYAY